MASPHPTAVHLEDVEARPFGRGDIATARRRLGAAAGCARVGLSHYVVEPGRRQMPLHVHADEEEIAYVLSGSGLSVQGDAACEIRAGDCVVHGVNGAPHTKIASEEGLEVLVFGSGSDTSITYLPRADAWWLGPRWIPSGPNPFKLEAEAGPLEPPAPGERFANVIGLDDVEATTRDRGGVRRLAFDLTNREEVRRSGLRRLLVAPGMLSNPPHCHSVEEELFYVLAGTGELELWDRERLVHQVPIRAGHVIACPPATRTSHAFRASADGELDLLAYGTDDDADACFYPRSQKVSLRGLGATFRIERRDYWDGEE